jgi:hypothetical protein
MVVVHITQTKTYGSGPIDKLMSQVSGMLKLLKVHKWCCDEANELAAC